MNVGRWMDKKYNSKEYLRAFADVEDYKGYYFDSLEREDMNIEKVQRAFYLIREWSLVGWVFE